MTGELGGGKGRQHPLKRQGLECLVGHNGQKVPGTAGVGWLNFWVCKTNQRQGTTETGPAKKGTCSRL